MTLLRLPANALQEAVYGLLKRNLVTQTPIYDFVPEKAGKPFITFGEVAVVPNEAKDLAACACEMAFNIYSDYRGRKEPTKIAEDITHVLMKYKIKMNASSFQVMNKEFVRFVSGITRDDDGFAASVVFKFWIQDRKEEAKESENI